MNPIFGMFQRDHIIELTFGIDTTAGNYSKSALVQVEILRGELTEPRRLDASCKHSVSGYNTPHTGSTRLNEIRALISLDRGNTRLRTEGGDRHIGAIAAFNVIVYSK